MSDRERIEECAAHWLMRRDDASWNPVEQDELDAWLDASFAHKAAFWRLEQGWREADRIAAVSPVPPGVPRWQSFLGVMGRPRLVLPTALAASLAGMLALPLWLAETPDRAPHAARTGVGQTTTIDTEDGSRIELNTNTVVRTRVLADSRDAWLDRGEAFFDIHHEEGRPFRVHAGPKTITVLGTRFSVRRDGGKVTVAVVSGRVRIEDAGPSAPLASLARMLVRTPKVETSINSQ